ncbi:hypothetical protein DFH07DRAFT_770894 [Mycena maculata]|uniref:Uncharacterized protein n=1 Tax=Mycena maculata TaxID=230809 RepID=A0AAD7JIE5_9AGAR|nr:hypothetical protein DFH07DRAFT_770894 [Mycena maculata]
MAEGTAVQQQQVLPSNGGVVLQQQWVQQWGKHRQHDGVVAVSVIKQLQQRRLQPHKIVVWHGGDKSYAGCDANAAIFKEIATLDTIDWMRLPAGATEVVEVTFEPGNRVEWAVKAQKIHRHLEEILSRVPGVGVVEGDGRGSKEHEGSGGVYAEGHCSVQHVVHMEDGKAEVDGEEGTEAYMADGEGGEDTDMHVVIAGDSGLPSTRCGFEAGTDGVMLRCSSAEPSIHFSVHGVNAGCGASPSPSLVGPPSTLCVDTPPTTVPDTPAVNGEKREQGRTLALRQISYEKNKGAARPAWNAARGLGEVGGRARYRGVGQGTGVQGEAIGGKRKQGCQAGPVVDVAAEVTEVGEGTVTRWKKEGKW